jgi:predicted nuclease of predicted toxin-antitoxin system
MRFVIDANLPPALARWLVSQGHEAWHANELGLECAKDRSIWLYAKEQDCCIVTKDEDFVILQAHDRAGQSVVWVRIGNALRRVLLVRLEAAWPEVMQQLDKGAKVVEIR